MQFRDFKIKMQKHFNEMINGKKALFVTDVDKDMIWETYLKSFPAEEQQSHNCNSCRQFLRPYANLVTIENNKVVSIWDFTCDEPYASVAKALHKLVISKPIKNVFVTKLNKLGTDYNQEHVGDKIITWNHFYVELPTSLVLGKRGNSEESTMADYRSSKDVFKRGLDELKMDAINTILELINQNSIYRGQESKGAISAFKEIKAKYDLLPESQKDNFAWDQCILIGPGLARLNNTAMGTLLNDVSKGVELDVAVSSFERMVAPANYKRPNTILTKQMIKNAELKIQEMGFEESLGRRYAMKDDISINNALFVDRPALTTASALSSVLDDLKKDVPVNPKNFNKTEEVTIEDFISKVLPTAKKIELLMENQFSGNLVSLVAPKIATAPSMFKWKNGFSWSYVNDVTDSIKENVKAAGGNVDGVLRFSIQWNEKGTNNIDFDAHAKEPNGTEIYFGNYRKPGISSMSGQLDVDITSPNGEIAVENITWTEQHKMKDGTYNFWVRNFASRTSNGGFTAQIAFNGEIHNFEYAKSLRGKEDVKVASVNYSKVNGFTINNLLPATSAISSKELWGIHTNQFQKVSMILLSPNHWDNEAIGNKHYMFMLEGCNNPQGTRGFYNEFLNTELMAEKRVFEALGGKLTTEPSPLQLSGLGFSETMRNSVICKVEGHTSRIIKIKF